MTEPSVEGIVAIFDKRQHPHKHLTESESRIVIASWRERGEALEDVLKFSSDPGVIKFVRAALKARP